MKTTQEYVREIRAVSRADILKAANDILDERRMSVGAIGPYHTKAAFLKAAGL